MKDRNAVQSPIKLVERKDYKMMNISRSILLASLMVTIWMGLSEAKDAVESTPIIGVEQPTYEFGEVSQGDIVKYDFRVFNRGSAPLEIKEVRPD